MQVLWSLEDRTMFYIQKIYKKEVVSNRLVFYDNNLLANSFIEDLLREIAELKYNGKPVGCESQCGFDGRLLTPKLAELIRKTRFDYPKIAWDGPYSEWPAIEKQIKILVDAGYKSKDIQVFMLYDWEIPFEEMEEKRKKCWEWKSK
jgi:hypothetical protein